MDDPYRSTRTLGQMVAGPLARVWANGDGPTKSGIESAIESAGLDPRRFTGSKEAIVRSALSGAPSNQVAVDLTHELIDLLREERFFERADEVHRGRLEKVREALRKVGGELSAEGELTWTIDPLGGQSAASAASPRLLSSPSPGPVTGQSIASPTSPKGTIMNDPSSPPTIFFVHGHDISTRDQVEVQVRRWMPRANIVVLDQKASSGKTLVEKFEAHADTATYAIVLATPDDEGRLVGARTLQPRARQNVVFELGYFFGKLGRDRVAVMNAGVDQPSDVQGIVYIALSKPDWRTELARELEAAGLEGDWLR